MAEETFLSLELPSEKRYISGGRFSPTMVIGLGGTGAGVVRRMKQQIRKRYGEGWDLIRYLCIDTDTATFSASAGLPNIERWEQCDISLLKGEAQKVVKEMKNGGRRELGEWFIDGLTVDILDGKGAGTVRPCGRFCLFTHFSQVNTALDRAIADLSNLETRVRTLEKSVAKGVELDPTSTIYIVSSCCGGSGAGMVIDIAALVRYKLQTNPPRIKGILALPSAFSSHAEGKPQKKRRLQANAVAALLELQYLMDPAELNAKTLLLNYPGGISVGISSPLFDECFLVEGKNAHGESLSSKDQVFELISRALAQEVSPVGTQIASRQVDLYAEGLLNDCIETKRPRIFSSFGVTSIVVPANQLLTYCCLNRSLEIVNHLKGITVAADMETVVRDFESQIHLDEFGPHNQVLDALLTDSRHKILDVAACSMKPEEVREAGVQSRKQMECEEWIRKTVEVLVKRNLEVMEGRRPGSPEQEKNGITDKTKQIQMQLDEIMKTQGLASVRAWLVQLKSDFEAMRSEILAESDDFAKIDWVKQIKVARNKAASFHFGDGPENTLAEIHNRYIRQRLLEPARKAAVELFNSLQTWTNTQLNRTDMAVDRMGSVERDLTQARSSLEAQFRKSSSAPGGFTLERGVMTWEDFATFYNQQGDGGDTAASEWLTQDDDIFKRLEKSSDELARELPEFCRRYFETAISQMNVIDAINLGIENENREHAIQQHLDTLFNLCCPFWQMVPRQDQEFVESLLVGIPVAQDDLDQPVVQTVKEWIDLKLTAGDSRPAPVPTGYPHAIEVARRAYGARPFYHAEWASWKQDYHAVADANKTAPRKQPLHIHKDYDALMRDMEPIQLPQVAFAVAIAFGYIARSGARYLFGYQTAKNGLKVPKYKSDLSSEWITRRTPVFVSTITPSDTFARRCTRAKAMESFIHHSSLCEQLLAIKNELAEEYSKQYISALTRHCDTLKTECDKKSDADEKAQLQLEIRCLEHEIGEKKSWIA